MRIILSSTLADLAQHRKAISDAFDSLNADLEEALRIELVKSEDQAATAPPDFAEWISQFESTSWYLLVLGWRYGYIPEGESKSVIELEYEAAKEHCGTVLCFIPDADHPVAGSLVETGEGAAKLRRFRERLQEENLVRQFGSPEDLAQKIVISFTRWNTKPYSEVSQDILDRPELESQNNRLRHERENHLSTISGLRRRFEDIVPATPIWRTRKFTVDSTLGFCLLPFQDEFMQVYEEAALPSLEAVGLRGLHAGQIFDNREIMEDIWESICTARVVIADVTQRNANVFYELGICHTLGKEVIVITQNSDDVPFDIRHRRYIHYQPDRLTTLRATLQQTIQRIVVRTAAPEDDSEA